MEIILKGHERDVQRFLDEIILPTVMQRQQETGGRYFRITGDFPDYWRHIPEGMKVRKIRGYFPEHYYTQEAADGAEVHKESAAAAEAVTTL